MNSKLNYVQNWSQLARQAAWSATTLAKQLGVSPRTLERFFSKQMGKSPKTWLIQQRQEHAKELLHAGYAVKETASQLGYRYSHNFSRGFKHYWGSCPTKQT